MDSLPPSSEISSPSGVSIPAKARRVLVLQGGGALGSYQAGAYQALCRYDFEPAWVAGISIGAINAAIIAGNPRERRVERLKEFWDMASSPVPWQPMLADDHSHSLFNETSAAMIAALIAPIEIPAIQSGSKS
jgi:NTE family protein